MFVQPDCLSQERRGAEIQALKSFRRSELLDMNQYELAKFGRDALNQYQTMTPILIAGLCYLIITVPLSQLSRRLERRYGSGGMTTRGVGV